MAEAINTKSWVLALVSIIPDFPILMHLSSCYLRKRKAQELSSGLLLDFHPLCTHSLQNYLIGKNPFKRYFTTHYSFPVGACKINTVFSVMGFWPVQSGWKHSEVPRFLQNNRKLDAQGFRQWGLSARREYHEAKLKNMQGLDAGQKGQ